jgi:Trk K+ transport system NAD-binding subunit
MRFLIAGMGSIGQRHLRNLTALGERDIILYRTYKGMSHDADMERFRWSAQWKPPYPIIPMQ